MYYLKCDASDCDVVQTVDAITEDQIGMPCPKCGANLLTREDFEESKGIFAMAEIMQALGLLAEPDSGAKGEPVSLNYHKGETRIKHGPNAHHRSAE